MTGSGLIDFYPKVSSLTGHVNWVINEEDAMPSGSCSKRVRGDILTVININTGEVIATAEYYRYADANGDAYDSMADLEDATFDFFAKASTSGSGGLVKYNTFTDLPASGSDSVLYYVEDTKLLYVWNGSSYEKVESKEITVVNNYSALPDPTTVPNKFYWCSNSQGTSWLPGSHGGTYYDSGLYYSNGLTWEFLEVPYEATQAEVNTGTINDKFVTPLTLNNYDKWSTKQDTIGVGTLNGNVLDPTSEVVVKYLTSDALQDMKEPTGFVDGSNIDVVYSLANRTITLGGSVKAYFKGRQITELVDGWVSDVHPLAVADYFLYYNGSEVVWSTSPWSFDMLQIAFVSRLGFAIRETHGLMPWEVHKHLHQTVGTYLVSGADFTGFVLNSTTAINRRPLLSETALNDEDLTSVLPALATRAYTISYLTGTGNSAFNVNNSEIVLLSGNTPFYNQFTGGNWVQTLMPTNAYAAIFVIAIPTTSDSLNYRYLFIQPQTQSTTLATIQAITAQSINYGTLATSTSEYMVIGKIIVRFTAGNWTLISVEKITGSKNNSLRVQGAFLSSVATASPYLTGNGTVSSPITFVNPNGWIDYSDSATAITPLSVTANVERLLTNDGLGLYGQTAAAPLNVTQLFNTTTNKLDFSQLSVYDELIIRVEIEVTVAANNAQWFMFIRFDEGGSTFDEPISGRSYHKTSGTYPMVASFPFYIGRETMRVNPSSIYFKSDTNCTVVVKGFYISVRRR